MKDGSWLCALSGRHEWTPDLIPNMLRANQERCRCCGKTRSALTDRARLQNLSDALTEDILAMSDEELAAEAAEEGIDLEDQAVRARTAFARATTTEGPR